MGNTKSGGFRPAGRRRPRLCDRGSSFLADTAEHTTGVIGAKNASIAPATPWENDFVASFDAKLRDEFLDGAEYPTTKLRCALTKS